MNSLMSANQLDQANSDVRRAEAQAQRAQAKTAAAQETEPTSGQGGSDGTYTVGDFTFSDVQVTQDFVGDFEIRAPRHQPRRRCRVR